jgi:TolB-like protein/Flp pilus assembly protein TadD
MVSPLKQLIVEIHRRSIWQVLVIYVAGAWFSYEIIDAITDRLSLPAWLPVLAIILFLFGLPFVVATAFVREDAAPSLSPAEATPPDADAAKAEIETAAVRQEVRRRHRLLTWRTAGFSFMAALALWGVVAAGLLLFQGGGSAASDGHKSVAVLPFSNMSGDPENEYFSDGITDDIITQLSKIADLKVISRTSVMQYKGTEKNLRQIGEELGVATILEGGVRKVGDRVRINAQLVNASSDAHLWAETYDRELTDIFAIQGDVAQQIASALRSTLTPDEQERLRRHPTDNLQAYELYIQGRFFWNRRTVQDIQRAIELFERATELDSTYALAYAGLADTYLTLYSWNWMPWADAYPQADRTLRRALELDPLLPEAHASRAVLLEQQLDRAGAEAEYLRAIELAPGYAPAHHWYALMLANLGRFDEARAEILAAAELDPLAPIIGTNVGQAFFLARDYDAAIAQLEATIESEPAFQYAWVLLGRAYAEVGRNTEAVAALRRAVELEEWPNILLRLAYVLERAGQSEEANRIVEENTHGDRTRVALVYVAAGDAERAFEWLERAHADQSPFLHELKVEPGYDPIRSDPRFGELLRRMRLE